MSGQEVDGFLVWGLDSGDCKELFFSSWIRFLSPQQTPEKNKLMDKGLILIQSFRVFIRSDLGLMPRDYNEFGHHGSVGACDRGGYPPQEQ